MTSEPDSKPGRRPPTIELKATEVDNAAPARDPAATEPAAPDESSANQQTAGEPGADRQASTPQGGAQSGSRLKSHAVGAAIGAVVTAAVAGGLWTAGFVPSHEAAPPPDMAASGATSGVTSPAAAVPPAANKEISARLDKIERTIQAQRPEPALGNRLTATEAQTKSIAETLATLNRRVDDIAATAQSAAKQANAATAAADSAKSASETASQTANQTTVQPGDIDALAKRIATLESAIKALSDGAAQHQAASSDDQAARLTIAAEALRAAVERGAPYQAELAAVQSLGVAQSSIAPLEPFAADGVPTVNALAHDLATLLPTLARSTDVAPRDMTFLGRLKANAQKLVHITPIDAPVGNDPSGVTARLAVDAAHADLAAALRDSAALPETAKPLVADWVKKTQARDAAISASRLIAADALAALSKPAAQ